MIGLMDLEHDEKSLKKAGNVAISDCFFQYVHKWSPHLPTYDFIPFHSGSILH